MIIRWIAGLDSSDSKGSKQKYDNPANKKEGWKPLSQP